MGWISVVISAISLARELVQYLNEKECDKTEVNHRLKNAKQKIHRARSDGSEDSLKVLFDADPPA